MLSCPRLRAVEALVAARAGGPAGMPALSLFGRTWLVAADDLPIPMMCLMVVHVVWCAPPERPTHLLRLA